MNVGLSLTLTLRQILTSAPNSLPYGARVVRPLLPRGDARRNAEVMNPRRTAQSSPKRARSSFFDGWMRPKG